VGDTVIKYGCEIGRIVQPVKAGQLVHVHNLKTKSGHNEGPDNFRISA